MFRNRSFNVKMVKDQDVAVDTPIQPIDYEKIVQTVAKSAILVIGAYMGADTARQVIIAMVTAEL